MREPIPSVSIPLPAGPLPSPADDIVPPLKNRPTMREPLPGWGMVYGDGWSKLLLARWPGMPLEIAANMDGRYCLLPGLAPRESGRGLYGARIAAEDAARAMVADMAAALGGSVTWGESEGSDG